MPSVASDAARVTMMPIAVDSKNAGSVVASALPIDNTENICSASTPLRCFITIPIAAPPTRLIDTMMMAADRIASDEFACAVHGAIEIRLCLHRSAACTRLRRIDQPRVQFGINGHLLPRHGIEREARGDFRNPLRAVRHDNELHNDEDREQQQTDDGIAAHHEGSRTRG